MVVRISVCEENSELFIKLQDIMCKWAKTKNESISFSFYSSIDDFIRQSNLYECNIVFIDAAGIDARGFSYDCRKKNSNICIVYVTNQSRKDDLDNNLFYYVRPLAEYRMGYAMNKALDRVKKLRPSAVISTDKGDVTVAKDDVLFLEELERFCVLVHTEEHVYHTRKSLSATIKAIDGNIFRCNRHYAVNSDKIIIRNENSLILSNGFEFNIAYK